MNQKNNIYVLIDRFDPVEGEKIYRGMMDFYSSKQAVNWLKKRVKQFEVSQKLLKQLEDTGRLTPVKSFRGIRYSKNQLMQYYLETMPRH